ncbi:hypothetical protein KKK_21035 [Pseudomonas putida B6-2]|nr:hypothetical protein KKK_21035 [Pseudomonas putida B6-2]
MSIGSMPWWLTTTVAVAVSAIEAVLWRGHAVTLSRIGANFRQKEGADSLAVHPLAPCRHQHQHQHQRPRVLLRMRLYKLFNGSLMNLATVPAPPMG